MGKIFITRTCSGCGGQGQDIKECKECSGNGYSSKTEKISITVPVGIKPLSVLKIKEMGNETYINDQKIIGDLYVVIDYPTRQNGVVLNDGNIYASVKVPFDKMLGENKIKINVLNAKEIEMQLSSEKGSGYEYRIENAGITPDKNAYIKVFADIPQNKIISKKEKEEIIKVVRDVYGDSNITFTPTTIN